MDIDGKTRTYHKFITYLNIRPGSPLNSTHVWMMITQDDSQIFADSRYGMSQRGAFVDGND